MDAIAVVLVLEDYQNSIAKNLRVRDVTVDIYGWLWFFPQGRDLFPPDRGRDFFSPGRGGNLLVYQTGGEFVFIFFKSKAIQADQ